MVSRIRRTVVAAITIAVIVAIASSCGGASVYCHYEQTDVMGWNMDSLLRYEVPVPDTTSAYDMAIRVRSTDVYPYENLWLFMQTDSVRDTIQVYLSNDHGERLGNEHNGYNDVRIQVASAIRYVSDTAHITIQQGMRDADLVGICAIGLEVKKAKE